MSLINFWWLFTVATNTVEILVAIMSTVTHENITYRLTGIGLSIFLSYINIIQYFEHLSSFHVLFCTLLRGIPEVCKFVLCVLPILCAFAFLGVLVFWPVSWFATPSNAFATLFSLLNGDVLHDNFLNLRDVHYVFSQVYLYLFLCFFIAVVLNVNITIIGEAFLKAQKYDRPRRSNEAEIESERETVFASAQRMRFPRFSTTVLQALDEIDPAARVLKIRGEEEWLRQQHETDRKDSPKMTPRITRFLVDDTDPRASLNDADDTDLWVLRQRGAAKLLDSRLTFSEVAPILSQLMAYSGRSSREQNIANSLKQL